MNMWVEEKTIGLLLFFLPVWCLAQSWQQPARFEHFGRTYDPFPQVNITAIFKDHLGLMWFGSQAGLFRYDGFHIRWYLHEPQNAQSITGSNIHVIFEDSSRQLWIGTSNGLNLMDREAGTFRRFEHDPDQADTLSGNQVLALCEGLGRLWIGLEDGVDSFDGTAFRHYTIGAIPTDAAGSETDQSGRTIRGLVLDRDGVLWTSNGDLLFRYDPEVDRFVPDLNSKLPKVILVLKAHPDGGLLLGTDQDVMHYRPAEGLLESPTLADQLGHHSGNINSLGMDADGSWWVGTGKGLIHWPELGEQPTIYLRDEGNPESLRDDNVRFVYVDDLGLVWAATNGNGVDRLNTRKQVFEFMAMDAWPMAMDGQGFLWVGTKYQGLARINVRTGARRWYLNDSSDLMIRSLFIDQLGILWIGEEAGFFAFDPQREKRIGPNYLKETRVWSVRHADAKTLYVGTEAGLYLFDTQTKEHRPIQLGSSDGDPPLITSLSKSADGKLWIGTYFQGLCRYDPALGNHVFFGEESGNPRALSDNAVIHVNTGRDGSIWVSTHNGGLNRFFPAEAHFQQFTLREGLPSNSILASVQDRAGRIWANTDKGLVKLTPENGDIQLFQEEDGFLASPGTAGSCWFDEQSDAIYFGGGTGLIRFYPDTIQPPSTNFLITRVSAEGRDLKHFVLPGDTLTVDRHIRTFMIEYTLLDYLSSGETDLAYIRRGLDADWVPSDNYGHVEYNRFPPLRREDVISFRGQTRNGLVHEANLNLLLEPPFWVRWLPLMIILVISGFAATVYWVTFRIERRKRKRLEREKHWAVQQREIAEKEVAIARRQIELEEEACRRQESHAVVVQEHLDQISTAIATDLHDGPLSDLHGVGFQLVTLGSALPVSQRDQLTHLSDKVLPEIRTALRNICGEQLLPDFRHGLEAALLSYIGLIEDQYPELIIHFENQSPNLEMSQSLQAGLFRMFRTLLKNVGLHACAKQVFIRLDRGEDSLFLVIRDDGCGFKVPPNWDEYRQAKRFGVYLAAHMAETLGGKLTIESELGIGTTARIALPLIAADFADNPTQDQASPLA